MSGHWKTWLLLSIALFQLSSNVIGDPLYTPPGSDPKRKELLLRRALNVRMNAPSTPIPSLPATNATLT